MVERQWIYHIHVSAKKNPSLHWDRCWAYTSNQIKPESFDSGQFGYYAMDDLDNWAYIKLVGGPKIWTDEEHGVTVTFMGHIDVNISEEEANAES